MSAVARILDIPAEQYHADPCDRPSLSASMAAILCTQSPAHARAAHPRLNPNYTRTEEAKYDTGTAAHALLLQGIDHAQVLDFPDWRTNAAKEARDLARADGRIPMLAAQWDDVQAMVAATRSQLDLIDAQPPLFTDGKPEQTLVWEEDGVTCRARLDWLRDDQEAIDDFKTTSRSANPEGWTRSTLYNIGADIQVAMYLRGLQAVTDKITDKNPEFRYCIQETYPPYALSVVSLGPAALELANAKVDYALGVWKRCLEADEWPAYPTRVCFAEPPAWLESQWLEREAREEEMGA